MLRSPKNRLHVRGLNGTYRKAALFDIVEKPVIPGERDSLVWRRYWPTDSPSSEAGSVHPAAELQSLSDLYRRDSAVPEDIAAR
jgi:hypothetical protein